MVKPVIVQGEVKAVPGSIPFPPAVSGSWMAAGPPVEVPHMVLKSDGKPILYSVTQVFMFQGSDSNGIPVVGTEPVMLMAKSTILTDTKKGVLLSGDQQAGNYQNKLLAIAGPNTFKSA